MTHALRVATAVLAALLLSACGVRTQSGAIPLPAAMRNASMAASPSNNTIIGSNGQVLHVMRMHDGGVERNGTTDLIYHGGPIQKVTTLYVVFWGWNSGSNDPKHVAPYLISFINGVGGSRWLGTDTQYYSKKQGHITNPVQSIGGTWYDNAAIPKTPSDTDIVNEALKAQAHFGLHPGADYFVATPHGRSTAGFGTNYCAYHGTAGSGTGEIAFTNDPYMPDAGPKCGANAVNSGSAGALDGVSIVAGHEIAEVQTDPFLNSWFDSGRQEIGDKCAWLGLYNLILSTGMFAVQPLWSNKTENCQ